MDNKYPWPMDKDLDDVFMDIKTCIKEGFDTNGRLDYLKDRLRIAEAKVEELEEFARDVVKWSESYPVSVFGEPTPEQIDDVCKSSGFRIDKISAMVLRRFTKSWGEKALVALATK